MGRHLGAVAPNPAGDARGNDVEVLVVGAGPTGLLTACELLRRQVRVRIVDRAPEPMTAPRALSLWPRVLDILEDLGVLEEVRNSSVRINAFSYFSHREPLASFGFTEDLAARQLPQPETERVLTERLHTLGGKVERGVCLRSLDDPDPGAGTDAPGGVLAVLEHGGGLVERVRSSYLVGADGASSTVRGQLGIGFEGSTYESAFALIDTHIEGHLPSDEIRYYQDPSGTLVVVPQPAGVFRFLTVLRSGQEMNAAVMQSIVDERGPRGVRLTEPVWETVFRVHARRASAFQRGRVFLVGDAAHVHSPAGGQGMNNGLQDANNLAWKVASVLHGRSPDSMLLTYGRERREATRRIVRDTDLQTRAWMAGSRAQVLVRDMAFRLMERTGVVSRYYTPVMSGRRVAYSPVRRTQRPGDWFPCTFRPRLPGGVGVGGVLPRSLGVAQGMGGPGTDPLEWSVAVLAPRIGGAAWLAEVGRVCDRWPQVRVVDLTRRSLKSNAMCARPGCHLIRPDGHIAAHGHARDLDRLQVELGTVLCAGDEPVGPRYR